MMWKRFEFIEGMLKVKENASID